MEQIFHQHVCERDEDNAKNRKRRNFSDDACVTRFKIDMAHPAEGSFRAALYPYAIGHPNLQSSLVYFAVADFIFSSTLRPSMPLASAFLRA